MLYRRPVLSGLFLSILQSASGQLVVQSEKLLGFEGCDPSQQRQIVEAWHDAMKIADVVYKAGVNFDAVVSICHDLLPFIRIEMSQTTKILTRPADLVG